MTPPSYGEMLNNRIHAETANNLVSSLDPLDASMGPTATLRVFPGVLPLPDAAPPAHRFWEAWTEPDDKVKKAGNCYRHLGLRATISQATLV